MLDVSLERARGADRSPFEEGEEEGLGESWWQRLRLEPDLPFLLMARLQGPAPETTDVYTLHDPTRAASDLDRILEALGLSRERCRWIHPDAGGAP